MTARAGRVRRTSQTTAVERLRRPPLALASPTRLGCERVCFAAGPRRPRRRCRAGSSAQAIIETAIVLPVMLFMIAGFVALMLQVEAQQQMDSAVALAAEATFQAPRAAAGADGLPARCRLAWQTFEGSMTFQIVSGEDNFDHPDIRDPQHHRSPFLSFTPRSLCLTGQGRPSGPPDADIQCDIDAANRHRTICDASAELHYDRTPLAWAIFWTPRISAHAEAVAPPFRQ